ncbi:MAG: hypothetical protein V4714_16995 [Bacteroidota bacterium]
MAIKQALKLYTTLILLLISTLTTAQTRVVHVLVALCDNKNQGIVPVPKNIGNGQDPANNLYWGCGFGVKTFFKKQHDWSLIKKIDNPTSQIYERLVFKHKDSLIYLVADAYDGARIKQTVTDFLDYAAGLNKLSIKIDTLTIQVGGSANLIGYVGHDGLMDFTLHKYPSQADHKRREVIILACASRNYFYDHIKKTGAYPLLWTTNLMCPEAYTLDTAIDSWILHDSPATTREKASQTYNRYQKCGIHGARNLLVAGFEIPKKAK